MLIGAGPRRCLLLPLSAVAAWAASHAHRVRLLLHFPPPVLLQAKLQRPHPGQEQRGKSAGRLHEECWPAAALRVAQTLLRPPSHCHHCQCRQRMLMDLRARLPLLALSLLLALLLPLSLLLPRRHQAELQRAPARSPDTTGTAHGATLPPLLLRPPARCSRRPRLWPREPCLLLSARRGRRQSLGRGRTCT